MYTVVFQDLSSKQFTNMAKAKCEKDVRIVVFPNGGLVYPSNPSISDVKSYRAWKKRGAEKPVVKYSGDMELIPAILAKLKVTLEKKKVQTGICREVNSMFDDDHLKFDKAHFIMKKAFKDILKVHTVKDSYIFSDNSHKWDGIGYISPPGKWTPERENVCKLLIEYFS